MHVRDPVRVEVETALHARVATPAGAGRRGVRPRPGRPPGMRGLADRLPVAVCPGPARRPTTGHLFVGSTRRSAPPVGRPARLRWESRLTMVGVALGADRAFRMPARAEAVDGVGYLDEPVVAPDGVRVVAVVRGACGRARRCGSGTA